MPESSNLQHDLKRLLNKHSRENMSNTPDFILARFLEDSLKAFEIASANRENWYGCTHEPGMHSSSEGVGFAVEDSNGH